MFSVFGPSIDQKIDTLLSYTKVQIPPYIKIKIREYITKHESELPNDVTGLKALIEHPCTTNYLNYVLFENGKALVDCDTEENKKSPFCFTELALERKTYPNYVDPHAREFANAAEAAEALTRSFSKSRYRLNDALSGDFGLLAKVIAKEITAELPENKRYKLRILDSIEDDVSDIAMIFVQGYPLVMENYLVFENGSPIAVKSDRANRLRFKVCNEALPGPKEPERFDTEDYGHRFDGRLYSGSKIFDDQAVLKKIVNKTCQQANRYDGDKKLQWQLYAEDIRRKTGQPFPTEDDVSIWKGLTGMKPCENPVDDELWTSYLDMVRPAVSEEPEYEREILPLKSIPPLRLNPKNSATVAKGLRYGYQPRGGARKTQKMTRPKARRPLKQHAAKPATRKHNDCHRKPRRHTRSQTAL